VRLHRPERVRSDRRADRPSHCASSISQPWRRRDGPSGSTTAARRIRGRSGYGYANWGAVHILSEAGPRPSAGDAERRRRRFHRAIPSGHGPIPGCRLRSFSSALRPVMRPNRSEVAGGPPRVRPGQTGEGGSTRAQ
jgi:hypothetical protein